MRLETYKSEIAAVNLKTGEIVPATIITPAMREEIERKKREQKKISEKYKQYGNFYWFFYNVKEQLFDGNIDGATVSRVMYLATYLSYKNNKLYFDNKKPIHKKDLQYILNLTETPYKDFMRKCKNNDLLVIGDDDTVSLSDTYFKRGKLSKKDLNSDCFITRMYNNSIRYLYDNADLCFHKNLAYLFMVLPYASIDYNVICDNPWETDVDKVNPLTVKQICENIGYDPKNQKRLLNSLLNIKIKDIPAIRFILDAEGESAYINPSLYYAGDQYDKVWIMGKFKKSKF